MKIKIHDAYRKIVAVADSDLIGKTFSEDIREIKIRANFFDGEEKTFDEVVEIFKDLEKEDATFNIVGEESIKAALAAGIISSHGIIRIDGIPIALSLL